MVIECDLHHLPEISSFCCLIIAPISASALLLRSDEAPHCHAQLISLRLTPSLQILIQPLKILRRIPLHLTSLLEEKTQRPSEVLFLHERSAPGGRLARLEAKYVLADKQAWDAEEDAPPAELALVIDLDGKRQISNQFHSRGTYA